MNIHKRVELVAGDDWQLNATMLDTGGNPIDLTTATILWALIGSNGSMAVQPGDFVISLGSDPGECVVKIDAAHSTAIPGGAYTDYWRVTASGITQTLLEGSIGVHSDPMAAALLKESEVERSPYSRRSFVRINPRTSMMTQ
jgi:hypothetical protein